MRGMSFDLQGKGPFEAGAAQVFGAEEEDKGGIFSSNSFRKWKKGEVLEPRSVLDQRRSPSPPNSTSTLSSSVENLAHKWPTSDSATLPAAAEAAGGELQPIPRSLDMGVDDWETMLSEAGASSSQEQAFLRLIMGNIDDPSSATKYFHENSSPAEFDAGIGGLGFGIVDPGFGFEPFGGTDAAGSLPPPQLSALCNGKNVSFANPPTGMFFLEPTEEKKPQLFNPNFLPNSHQLIQTPTNPAFFLPFPSVAAAEQQQSNNSMPTDARHQQQTLTDHLFKGAELLKAGNFVGAHEILTRLNHQLPSPLGKPLIRSTFYFKEALQLLLANSSNQPPASGQFPFPYYSTPFSTSVVTPLDVVFKLSAYKAFSEVSPVLHFTNFTITQTLLEEFSATNCLHVIDFDIGVGGQWPSFMQELAQRSSPAVPLLKITAFVSPFASHRLEINLIRDNLSHFAAELNIPFKINISSIDSFNPDEILASSAGSNEATAVILPVGIGVFPSFSTMLHLVKQLLPKIVLVVDVGCDRSELPFSHHFFHAFQSFIVLLDSIDAVSSNLDMTNKIERFVLQPRIENCIIGLYRAADKMLPWRTLFTSASFVPAQFSNFTETVVECLLKRVQVRGFHVEKRQASLCLNWQRRELVSVSAWRC